MISLLAAATLGISGGYFESRTCSIFAGPCHYNSEIMTDGRGAVVALKFAQGRGLEGLSVAAVVLGPENLNRTEDRKTVVYLDSRATESQSRTILELLRERARFGSIVSVRPATIEFGVSGLDSRLSVSVGDDTVVSAMTDSSECKVCSMPGELWFEPLVSGTNVNVATVRSQSFLDGVLGEKWIRNQEPAAFVGTFTW